jgi:hypothetical protein
MSLSKGNGGFMLAYHLHRSQRLWAIYGLFFALFIQVSSAQTATILGGVLEQNLSLTPQADPYQVVSDLIVPEGVRLSIEAGVTLEFEQGVSLIVSGELLALGSKLKAVHFSCASTAERWGNVRVLGDKDLPCYDGDGVYIADSGGSRFRHCEFTGGGLVDDAQYGGGVLYLNGSAPMVQHCKFEANRAERGGAMVVYNFSTPLIEDCIFQNNEATVDGGGAIFCFFYSDALVQRNFFVENDSERQGGALYISVSDPMIVGNAFIDNTAKGMGGAAFVSSSSPTIKDNAIYENRGVERTHGLVFQADSRPVLRGNSLLSGGLEITAFNSTQDIDASLNWWGTLEEVDISQRQMQRGRRVDHRIHVEPWREEPVANLLTQPVEIESIHVMVSKAYADTLAFDLVEGHRARVQVVAKDRNPYAVDQTSVRLSVLQRPEVQLLLHLKETEKASGIFRGRFSVSKGGGDLAILPVEIGESVLMVSSADDRVIRLYEVDEARPVVHALAITSDPDPTHLVKHNFSVFWSYFDLSAKDQSAWQLQVSERAVFDQGLKWDSGVQQAQAKVRQAQYAGSLLEDGTIYFFRLRAKAEQQWSQWVTFLVRSDQPGYSLRLNSLPDPPIFLEPDQHALLASHRPLMRFATTVDQEGDSLNLHVQLAADAYFQRVLTESHTDISKGFECLASEDLADNQTVYARARFTDGFEWTDWSQTRGFDLNPIEEAPLPFDLVDPFGIIADVRPTLTWEASADADPQSVLHYEFFLGKSADFSQVKAVLCEHTSFRPVEELENTTEYFWTVKAVDQTGLRTRATRVLSFFVNTTPSVPLALFPQGEGEIRAHETFKIEPSVDPWPADVLSYDLQVSADGDFTRPLAFWRAMSFEDLTGRGIDAYPDAQKLLSDDRRYFWRSRSVDNHKAASKWSKVRAFYFNRRNDAPTLAQAGRLPADASTVRKDPTLSWDLPDDGDLSDPVESLEITLQLSPSQDFSLQVQEFRLKNERSLPLDAVIQDNTHWYWRMTVEDDEGASSGFSETYSFEYNRIEEAPLAFACAPIAQPSWFQLDAFEISWSESVDLDWQDPVSYSWVLASDENFENLLASGRQAERNLRTQVDLESGTTVYFRVKAVDVGGLETRADVLSIPVDSHPTSPVWQLPSVDLDLDGKLEWSASTDPDPTDKILYRVRVYDDKQRRLVDVKGIPGRRVTLSQLYGAKTLPEDQPLTCRVTAVDPHGLTARSEPITIWFSRQNDAPTTPTLLEPEAGTLLRSMPLTLNFVAGSDGDHFDTPAVISHELEVTRLGSAAPAKTLTVTAGLNRLESLMLGDNSVWDLRLRSVDAGGLKSEFSESMRVTVNFENESPTPPRWLKQTQALRWVDLSGVDYAFEPSTDPDPGAQISYEVELRKRGGSSLLREKTSVGKGRVNEQLTNAQPYELLIWAVDELGLESSSQALPFVVDTAPGPVSFLQADKLIVNQDVSIAWSKAKDPDPDDLVTYEFVQSSSADFSKLVSRVVSEEFTLLQFDRLEPGRSYFLRVRARDDQDVVGPWSGVLKVLRPLPPVKLDSVSVGDLSRFNLPDGLLIQVPQAEPVKLLNH